MVLRSHPGFEGLVNVWLAVNHESEGIDSSTSECQSSIPGEEYQAWYHAWHRSSWGLPCVNLVYVCLMGLHAQPCNWMELQMAEVGKK